METTSPVVPLELSKEEFRRIGYELVDTLSEFLETISTMKVSTGETPEEIENIIGLSPLPEEGIQAEQLISRSREILLGHSLFNGHPKFLGYITASPSPIGAFADLLAAAVNPNVGANILSPAATQIEKQTIRWLAQLIGVSADYGGILVSGGNMANFTAFLAARSVKAPATIKEEGISNSVQKLTIYCPVTTHTWIEKAAVLFGTGKRSIRWIKTTPDNRMDIHDLEQTIADDIIKGYTPLMVIGNAGDVSTGAIDDLNAISGVCKNYNLWFHVDGAYGLPAAMLPELKDQFRGIEEADSIALDPHKWLYSPLEAGCTLVKDPANLMNTFSAHPVYYNFNNDGSSLNYYEYGLENSRGFRALKVWLTIQHAGRQGFINMIRKNIQLSELLFTLIENHPELEGITQNLSIATFRYATPEFKHNNDSDNEYLNKLNEELLNALQHGGELFLSNAVISGKYCLRTCIVNFRTTEKDIYEIVEILVREGRKMHKKLTRKQETSV